MVYLYLDIQFVEVFIRYLLYIVFSLVHYINIHIFCKINCIYKYIIIVDIHINK